MVVYQGRIVNPFTKEFETRFLSRIIPVTEERHEVLSRIIDHFTLSSKEHYLRKRIIPIGDTEIPEVKEVKLNICTLCFNHCSKRHINEHLKTTHLVKNRFLQYTFVTLGYIIPNQKREMSYFYRKRMYTEKPIDMFDVGDSAARDNSEDKFLRYIRAEDYYGKGYTQFLAVENEQESGPVVAAVEMYMMKKRDHMRASHTVFSKMSAMGILKTKYIFTTRVLYAKLAGRFLYTFARYSDNPVLVEAIDNPTGQTIEAAMLDMMERYVLVSHDPSEKFLQAVFISLMVSDDTFAESRVRAKTLDAINYCLKLAASDYMAANNNVNDVLLVWYETVYYEFEHYRNVHHKFNMTTPTFQTRVDEEDIRKAAIGAVNFSIDDLSKLVRCLVEDYHKQACALLPKGVISVDDLYTEFTRNAVEFVNCKDRGYSVFFGTPVINDRTAKCLLRFRDAMGDLWDRPEYMKIVLQKLTRLNLNLLVCIMITCGSPFRVTELYTLTFANPVGMTRSMYYSNGLIQLNIRYNKNTHSTLRYASHTKVLPEEVSKIVIHYISVVRYLEIAIVETHGAEELSSDLKEPSYRGSIDCDDDSDKEEDENEADVANRQPRRAMLRTILFLSPLGVRKGAQAYSFLERASERYVGERYTPRLLRQALVHFTRLLLTETRYSDVGFLKRIDKLAGHNSTTADMQYGVTHSNSLLPSVPINNIDIRISLEWHRILGLSVKDVKSFNQKEHRTVLKEIMSQLYIGREEIEAVGRVLYKDFKIGGLDHTHMLHDACNSIKDLLVVSPTGSGKSNAFKFPMLAEKKMNLPFVSIIICPFISLLQDMKEKLFDLQELKVEIFDPEKEHVYYVTCDVIIVQLEKVKEAEGLIRYFDLEKVFKYIRRLVLDEAHVLMEHRSFRAASIMKIPEVFGKGIPKMFLSATFPKLFETRIRRMFEITDWRVHRGETIRKNIEHIVFQGSFDVAKALRRIYETEVRRCQTKGIVFVYKRSLAIELAQDLKWLLFHGNMDPEEKANAYKKFAQAEEGMMIATSAFSHGVDIRRISHVITVGHVNSAIDFQQVVGRMWRGEPDEVGRSYVLFLADVRNDVVTPYQCINSLLASQLDGKEGENCSSLGCERCSVCDESKVNSAVSLDNLSDSDSDEEIEVVVIDDEDSEVEIRELYAKLRDCQFNIIKLYGLRSEKEVAAEALGVYSKAFFSTVINPGLIIDLGVCFGCLLTNYHAHSLDPDHESLKSMQCSLTPLLHAFIVFFLYENNNGRGQLESMMISPNLSSIVIRNMEEIIKDPFAKYKGIAKDLILRSAIERNHLEVSWQRVDMINDYLEEPQYDAAQLVYGSSEGWCELSRVTINALEIVCQFRFKTINGRKAVGFCFGCWSKLFHGDQKECHRGLIARILIYSYYEELLLKGYCLERGIKVEYPSV